jgi:hypothetical protein
MKLKVYVAGKLNDPACDYIKNMHNMIKEAGTLRKAGFAVYVPCIDMLEGLVDGHFEYEDYFNNSQPFLLSCDAVYVCPIGFESSEGTKREIITAEEHDIPVFYNIDSLCQWAYGDIWRDN